MTKVMKADNFRGRRTRAGNTLMRWVISFVLEPKGLAEGFTSMLMSFLYYYYGSKQAYLCFGWFENEWIRFLIIPTISPTLA